MNKKNSFIEINNIIIKLVDKKSFVILLVLVTLKLLVSLPIPIIQKKIVDNIVNRNISILLTLTLIFLIFSLIQIFTNVFYNIKYSLFLQKLNFNFRIDIINKIFSAKYFSVKNINSSYFLNKVYTDTEQIEGFILNIFLNVISNIIAFLYGTILIFLINYKIALMIFFIVFIWIFIYKFFKKKLYNHSYNLKEENSKLYSKFNESLSMLETIKKNNSFKIEINKLKSNYNEMINYFKKFINVYSIFTSISSSINLLISSVIICFGVIEIYNNKMTIGDLFAITASVNFMVGPIQSLLTILSDYPNFKVSCNRVLDIYSLPSNENGYVKLLKIDSIELHNVDFSFSNGNLIKDICYKFERNNIYVIYGKNGVGKTSIINILLKLLEKKNGEIVINDSINLEDIDTESYLKKIAVVEQEQRLFYDTLFNNMTYNIDKEFLDEDFNKLIKLVGLDNLIETLPQGLDTLIEENSINISGGQKQKIAIFRALLKDSDIIILDEPTSALDSLSIDELTNILNQIKKEKIIIIITHNSNFMKDSNKIINFEDVN